MENRGPIDKDVEKSVMEDICENKDAVDRVNTDQLSSKPDCTNLVVGRPKSPFQENMSQVNISRDPHDSDNMLL